MSSVLFDKFHKRCEENRIQYITEGLDREELGFVLILDDVCGWGTYFNCGQKVYEIICYIAELSAYGLLDALKIFIDLVIEYDMIEDTDIFLGIKAGFYMKRFNIIEWVFERFEIGVVMLNEYFDASFTIGDLDAVKWMYDKYREQLNDSFNIINTTACSNDFYYMYYWLYDIGKLTLQNMDDVASTVLDEMDDNSIDKIKFARWLIEKNLIETDSFLHFINMKWKILEKECQDVETVIFRLFELNKYKFFEQPHFKVKKIIEYCCRYNMLKLLQLVHERCNISIEMIKNGLNVACKYNNIDIARWICSLFGNYYITVVDGRIINHGIKTIFTRFIEDDVGVFDIIKEMNLQIAIGKK